ncbi:hypothetical protein [Shigella flexneri]|uniref:hypothetical protein n=1 Tax=Shigella flexneri TaxID=623 RepID=UPI00374CD6A5
MNIRQSLHDRIYAEYPQQAKEILLYFPTYEIMPSTIKMVMINEVVAITPQEDFYTPESGYFTTVARQLALAGLSASSGEVLLNHGIYLTSALKLPKTQITATPGDHSLVTYCRMGARTLCQYKSYFRWRRYRAKMP